MDQQPVSARTRQPKAKPDWQEETTLWQAGYRLLAGVDEAGRGAWAGPLVAAAVILPTRDRLGGGAVVWHQVCDSKQLSAAARELLYPLIYAAAVSVGVGLVSPALIDLIGLGPANRLAMVRAIRSLQAAPDHLLVDAFKLPSLRLPQRNLIRGDQRSVAIAAASIIAKVWRDRLMVELAASYPPYQFAAHKGYGTATHQLALQQHGPCAIHRHSYAPIKLAGAEWARKIATS